MNLPRERREAASPHEWLRHAQSDIRLARLALNAEILPEQICFHAQQVAEKAPAEQALAWTSVMIGSSLDDP